MTFHQSIDINQQIFSVTAQDEDLEANAEILYEITDGNEVYKLYNHCFKYKKVIECVLV